MNRKSTGKLKAESYSREDYLTAITEATFSREKGSIVNYEYNKLNEKMEASSEEWEKTGKGPYNIFSEKIELLNSSDPAYVYPHSEILYKIACVNSFRTALEKKSAKVGTGTSRAANQNGECSARAQSYQDAYLKSGRVDDMICMKKALEREMR